MNKQDRKELEKAILLIEQAKEIIETIRDGEQEKFDNLSEGLQASENGQQFESNAEALGEVADELDNQISSLQDL